MIMINNHNIHDGLARMNGFPTSCIQHYATTNNMSVSDVYKTCMLKSTEIALTNQITKFVFRNTPEFNVKSFLFLNGDKGTTRTCRFIRDESDNTFIN